MLLFKRSIINEILSHAGVVFSTLVVVWLSVLMVRLLGQAAEGLIGADIVLGIAAFSSITALPTILSVSLFIAVITTVSRNYRESEMVVWFSSGQSLVQWLKPVVYVALPISIIIGVLTIHSSPWAYQQIEEYRQRYEQRSDFAKVATGQFIETTQGKRVFFVEQSEDPDYPLGQVYIRVLEDDGWQTILTADHASFRTTEQGERYVDLGPGNRYDTKVTNSEFRIAKFDSYTMRIEGKDGMNEEAIREQVLSKYKARPIQLLLNDHNSKSDGQIMWRVSLPIAALNLAILAIPLGAVNPRMGRSGNLVIAGLIALLYMNLINLMREWISDDVVDFYSGTIGLNLLASLISVYFFWSKMKVKKPKPPLAN